VDIRPGELGEQAASILLARIEDPSPVKRQYVAAPKLVLRQSG
jgi:LacI family transcriptional regulator